MRVDREQGSIGRHDHRELVEVKVLMGIGEGKTVDPDNNEKRNALRDVTYGAHCPMLRIARDK